MSFSLLSRGQQSAGSQPRVSTWPVRMVVRTASLCRSST